MTDHETANSQFRGWGHFAFHILLVVSAVLALTLGAYLAVVASVTHLGYMTALHRTWMYLVPGDAVIVAGVFVTHLLALIWVKHQRHVKVDAEVASTFDDASLPAGGAS
jgi:hypothetical protein